MEAESIKTTYLDKDLDKFLNVYKSDGTALTYGHVLVKKLDKSRPRKADGPKGKTWSHPNYPVTRFLASQTTMVGVYRLNSQVNIVEPNWITWIQTIKQPVVQEIDVNNFISLMDGNVSFGTQCRDIAMLIHGCTGLRSDLGILQNPVASADSIYKVRSNMKDSQAPVVFVNTAGAPIEVQKSFANLTTVVYNHRGASFVWIVVPPSSSDALEACILSLFGEEMGESACSSHARHLSIWITPLVLQAWGIQFYSITQTAGQLLFLFPQTYYWGFSAGHNVIEFKTHAGSDWAPTGWNFCSVENPLCFVANNGQPGLVLGSLDGNNPQGGNQVDNLIDPTPRRNRKRKAVLHENVIEFDDPLPGPGPANPEAPRTNDGGGPSRGHLHSDKHPSESHPTDSQAAGHQLPVELHYSKSPFPIDNTPGHGAPAYRPRNTLGNEAHVPAFGESGPSGEDRGEEYVDNRPGYAPAPPGNPQTGAETEQEEADDRGRRVADMALDDIDVEWLADVNSALADERDDARRERDELKTRNQQLEADLRSSSERETRLREELQVTSQQREFCFTQMVEKDKIIDELRAELARR